MNFRFGASGSGCQYLSYPIMLGPIVLPVAGPEWLLPLWLVFRRRKKEKEVFVGTPFAVRKIIIASTLPRWTTQHSISNTLSS